MRFLPNETEEQYQERMKRDFTQGSEYLTELAKGVQKSMVDMDKYIKNGGDLGWKKYECKQMPANDRNVLTLVEKPTPNEE